MYLENVVSFGAEDHDALVEVMMLHGRGGIKQSQGGVHLGLKGVIRAPVVQVMAEARNQKSENLEKRVSLLCCLNPLASATFLYF